MFPSQQSNNSLNSSNPYQENIIPVQNLYTLAHNSMDDAGSNLSNRDRKSQRKKWSVSNENGSTSDNLMRKKMMHKKIEKQRRQEMSALHVSLRSLLPLEYIKGKRSMSDHMNGAENYIQDLKNKIKELSARRDELKKLSNLSMESGSTNLPSCVMVYPCLGGVEVVISCSFREKGLALSRVLEVLLEEGVDVVSCVSRKVNQTLLLTIHSQASDLPYVDLSRLQQKIIDSIIISKNVQVNMSN